MLMHNLIHSYVIYMALLVVHPLMLAVHLNPTIGNFFDGNSLP